MATNATGAAPTGKTAAVSSKVWIAVAGVVAAAGVVGGVLIANGSRPADTDALPEGAKLGYASGAVAVDSGSLQDLVDHMQKVNKGQFMTEYRNEAVSVDGTTFKCYIGNGELNTYDMYFQIFGDIEMTDQLYLSELLRPATVLKEITLEHPLELGTHTVYVVFTQVGEDLASIVGQVTITMEFSVIESNG